MAHSVVSVSTSTIFRNLIKKGCPYAFQNRYGLGFALEFSGEIAMAISSPNIDVRASRLEQRLNERGLGRVRC